MKILQINTTYNFGSVGRLISEIGDLLVNHGHESVAAFGKTYREGNSLIIRIGNKKDFLLHVINTRLCDHHGFSSKRATERFINRIKQVRPDIIHLHNIHGYYLHVGVLFEYLKKAMKPIIWTFHDCWPFTGHCSHFQYVSCNKWQAECDRCPNIHGYPKSWFIDNSNSNFHKKKEIFTGLERLLLVSPSEWLAKHLRNSFLSDYETMVINNGVDLDKFRPIINEGINSKFNINKKYILGVASVWTERKGLGDFFKLRKIIDPEIEIVLVGLSKRQLTLLPQGIKGISRTENINELALFYSGAEVFLNPTYVDNFPSVNIESLACGTPVITYNTGGSAESLDRLTGIIVDKGDINGMANALNSICKKGKTEFSNECRSRAERLYDKEKRYKDYMSLYQSIMSNN